MSRCKSCGAEILWTTTVNERVMPVDHEPVIDGPFALTMQADGGWLATHEPSPEGGYQSHFVTCPHADRHRR